MRIQQIVASIIVITFLPAVHSSSIQASSITAKGLLSWMDASMPLLVLDVRGRSAYQTATIAGAIDAGVNPLGYLPDDSGNPVVLIVPVDADPEVIGAWFNRLANTGHEVWVLENGLEAWAAAGGQIEKPEVTYTLPGSVPFIVPKGLCDGRKPVQIFE